MFDEPIPWMSEAACSEVGGDVFFPEKGVSASPARRLCGSCTVSGECLDYALSNQIDLGIFGGLTGIERQRLRWKRAS